MRKNTRDYDNAHLLEFLSNELIKRKSFILALKLLKSGNEILYADKLNEVLPLSQPHKILQLLISLSKPHTQKIEVSPFCQKVLNSQLSSVIQRTLPDSANYVHSDTFHIDRNKGLNFHYISYDNTSFENDKLKSALNPDQSFAEMMKAPTRFNS